MCKMCEEPAFLKELRELRKSLENKKKKPNLARVGLAGNTTGGET